jgi:hypothetical protein
MRYVVVKRSQAPDRIAGDRAVVAMRAHLLECGHDAVAARITCPAALLDWFVEILDDQDHEITDPKRRRARHQLRRIIAKRRAVVPDGGVYQ